MIGIICPVEAELKPYLENLADAKTFLRAMTVFYEGVLFGQKAALTSCGVGKVNAAVAAQIMIDKYAPEYIIVSGTAGGIDGKLKVGDTVISTDVVYHDLAGHMLTGFDPKMTSEYMLADKRLVKLFESAVTSSDLKQKVVFGRIATGDAFIEKAGRAKIIKTFNPLCVDMETAGVAHAAYLNGVPFIAVRSVSDTAEKSGLDTFRENCALASANSYKTVELFIQYFLKTGRKLWKKL